MKKQFVTYEIALKLKELGFDEECLGFWYVSQINNSCIELRYGMCIFKSTSIELSKYPKNVLAPLYQQVIDWFREEYNIVIEIVRQKYFDTYEDSYAYQVICKVYKNKELDGTVVIRDNKNNYIFYSYSEAREQAILKAIELCQKE